MLNMKIEYHTNHTYHHTILLSRTGYFHNTHTRYYTYKSQHAHRILSQYAHRNDRIRYIQVTIGYEHIQVTIHTIYKITQITHPVYTSHITYNT
ncbi:hypothetical protein GLOIN_2v1641637 [Rhizophagus irregularis DAOM 181602=DAOM 197198]|uniref:Uncharacterized protein n=1 Tax=Rhizophagus irregularis (strain DAOM 181602 / DAOM 197198 / MUCL 43194) TaxID=747089 RepID=A0A2P4PRE0_RHIID|nr:hypothetical protein GLOIN_2v1641637 [Rhizophagus irregularis DAOM 181602=DAOM 197198]POG67959.1 hypothetical protein GLOIN_2v1641637 [Rhizophagus irregularis DAOM 181602=DAOM 197198]|eukprot:XP_025174825.1 hypothetical protein GLOIN_2v1641637 [Rhizophagus irregularis DAOM 181602=DAOM 197198]